MSYQATTIEHIHEFDQKKVELKGWLTHKRSSGKIHFIEIRDGSGCIQCVMGINDVPAEVFERAKDLTLETSLVIRGSVRQDKRSALGFELGVDELEVMGLSPEYPISNKEHGVGFLLDHRHLWLRSSRQRNILRVRSALVRAIRKFFDDRDFVGFDAPIFTPNACEGTSTLFSTDYFGEPAYLTQSGQLYGEAGAMALGKVYVFGPTFRAEKSKTRRHLTEFWMVEPEMAFYDLEMNMQLAEEFVVSIIADVLKDCRFELEQLDRDISMLEKIKSPFPRISYTDAIDLLKKKGRDFEWGHDFGAEEETIISEEYDRPVLIHRYPTENKAFYFKKDPENEKVVLCVDMIAPEGVGEIIGGGQREDSLEVLQNEIKKHELNPDDFSWYLDLRRYGSVPHAGFGLGIERTLGWICGLKHVRESIPFPRMLERKKP